MTRVSLGTEVTLTDHNGRGRCVGLLSDGYVVVGRVHDDYLRLSVGTPDRATWTQAVAISFSSAKFLTFTVEADDSVHVSWNNSSGDMRYMKFTRTDVTEYTAGTATTVEEYGTGFFMGRRDIAVTPGGSVLILALTYIAGAGHHTAARLYFKKFGTSTWSEIWVSETETETNADLWGACSIAADATGLESGEQYFAVIYQLVAGKTMKVKSVKVNETTGADTAWTTITTVNSPTDGSHNARVISALVFTVSPQRWVVLGAVGHAKATTFTKPVAITCNRTSVIKRADGPGGVDGTDTYGAGLEGAYPSFALLRSPTGVNTGVVLTANTQSSSNDNRGVSARTIPLTADFQPSTWGPAVQLNPGGFSFISAGAQPRFTTKFLDAVIVRRDTKTHYYLRNTTPAAPTAVTPSGSAVVPTSKPRVAATLATSAGGLAVGRVRGEWQLASDAGFTTDTETVTEPVTGLGGAGVHSGQVITPKPTGDWYLRARTLSEFGTYGPYATTIPFTIGHPPALSQLQPTGYAKAGDVEFKAHFSDPYLDDEQTAIQVEVILASDDSLVFDSGKVAGDSFTFSDWDDFLNQPLRWRARAWDVDDTAGSWSDYVSLIVDVGPTIELEPYTTTTPTPIFEWTYEGNRTQKKWSLQIIRNSDNKVLVTGTGTGTGNSFEVPDPSLIPNNSTVRIVLTVWDTGDISTTITDTPVLFSWIPPLGPAMYILPEDFEATGGVVITWNDEVREEDFVEWRVYRKNAGVWTLLHVRADHTSQDAEGNYYFTDRTAPANISSVWAVVQVALRFGAEVESLREEISEIPEGTHYWLIDPTDADLDIKIYDVTADSFTDRSERQEIVLEGRGAKMELGTHIGKAGTLTAKIWNLQSDIPQHVQKYKLQALQLRKTWVWLRSPFGDLWKVSTADIQYTRVAGTGTDEILEVSIPYSEVV